MQFMILTESGQQRCWPIWWPGMAGGLFCWRWWGLLLRPRPKDIKPLPDNLSDHLLRDVGLPPEPQARKYWEIR